MDLKPQKCPRHIFNPVFKFEELSEWKQDGKLHRCGYCGSVHPDEFMEAIQNGGSLGTTDKNYKAYLHIPDVGQFKFYYPHLSQEQKQKFVELYNNNNIKYAGNFKFYVYPYFMTFEKATNDEKHT